MAQKQGTSKKMKRANGTRKAPVAKAGPRSGKAHRRPNTAGRLGLQKGTQPLFDAIIADREEAAAQDAKERRTDAVGRAKLLSYINSLPVGSVEALAAQLWLSIFIDTDTCKGIFQKVTDTAQTRIEEHITSELDQKRVESGFKAARKAMWYILHGASQQNATTSASA